MASRPNLEHLSFKTVSFSAIESFLKCPAYYHNKYIKKVEYETEIEPYFLLGGWAHEIIEEVIKNQRDPVEILESSLEKWVADLELDYASHDLELLVQIVKELEELLYRASSRCKDKSRQIRNKDGGLMKDPVKYPSSAFKSALRDIDSYKYKSMLDNQAAMRNPKFREFSIVWTIAEGYFLGKSFRVPKWAVETVGVEIGIGISEETKIEIDEGVSLLGYIDWVVCLEGDRLAIIDHKTSKTKPSPNDIIWNPQLNLYAYAYEKVYGRKVDIIGINSLRCGEVVAAQLNQTVMTEIVEHFKELYRQSQSDTVIKRRPTDYQSPCVKREYTTGNISTVCPFLSNCWGTYSSMLDKTYQKIA